MATPSSAFAVLHIVLAASSVPSDARFDAVVNEVREIWRPHLNVEFRPTPDPAAECGSVIWLRLAGAPFPGVSPQALGWMPFVDGTPSPLVTVSADRTRRLLAQGRWGGRTWDRLPEEVRARLFSRALGRAIAHEVGHFLLRSSSHPPRGLMRARFTVTDLLDGDRRRFRISPGEREVLRARVGQPAAPAPTFADRGTSSPALAVSAEACGASGDVS